MLSASNTDRALELQQEMHKCGIKPTLRTYHMLLSALGGAGRVHEMENLYQEMLDKDVVPSSVIYDIMHETYAKYGDESKVEALRKEMSEKGIAIDGTDRTNCELDRSIATPN